MRTVENAIVLSEEEYTELRKAAEAKGAPVKQPITTNKKVLWLDITMAILLTASVVVGEVLGHDMSNSAIVAGLWDTQLAAVIGFYSWKAKNENRSKHAMGLVRELADKYGIESVVSIAEITLRE